MKLENPRQLDAMIKDESLPGLVFLGGRMPEG